MASLSVLTFDAEGRAVDFEVWLDDLQLFLQCDSKDGLSLFDLTSGASTAPAADADSTVRSQWTTRDAAARLAVRSHLPSTERAHFSQYKSAKTLYDAVVARYSSPATAALSRLMLPYLFPDLAAFATVADLVAHLRTSDARYRAALPTADHFLSLCPTELTVDLLEERLAAAEKSILAVGASRGDRRTPFFEGCSPVPLLPLLPLLLLSTSLALRRSALRLPLVGDAAPARAREAGVVEGAVGEAVEAVEEVEVVVGVVQGVGESVAAEWRPWRRVAEGVEAAAAVVEVAEEVVLVAVQPRSVEALVAASASSSSAPVRPRRFSSFVSGTLGVGGLGVRVPALTFFAPALGVGRCVVSHTPRSAASARLTDAWRAQFPDAVKLPRWHDLLLQNVPIFDLDFDAILAAMYAFADITEGDCYLRVPPDPGTVGAALGASAAAALETAPRSRRLSRPVAVSLADPSGGPVLAHSSTVLPCPAAPSGLLSGLHLPSFSTNLVSRADLQDAWVDQFTPGGLVLRLPPARVVLWRTRLSFGTTALVTPPCLDFEGRQRAAPHSSSFPPTEAPLQTLHMDVWGPARVRGQGHERYFLLVVDDYSRYTTVFPLRSKGEVTETFTLPASPQQNGIAERRIGMVMDVARTSMIHAAAPHFLWPFAVQYAAHQINLQTSCLLAGDHTYTEVDGEGTPLVDPLPPQGPAPSGVSQVDPAEPVEVAVDSGAARGADPAGAGTGGAETGGAESGGAETGGAESGGAETGCAEPGGVAPEVAAGAAGAAGGATGAGAAGGGAGAGAAGGAGGATGATGGAGAAGGGAGAGAAGGAAGAGAAGAGAAGGAGACPSAVSSCVLSS
ncbi:unnamed protein product [Closterium sp. Naga37s-1]|nr:unnamed protein product [Closterium sp. Naga37s-1]